MQREQLKKLKTRRQKIQLTESRHNVRRSATTLAILLSHFILLFFKFSRTAVSLVSIADVAGSQQPQG